MMEKNLTCAPVTVRVVSSLLMTSYTPERLVQHQVLLRSSNPDPDPLTLTLTLTLTLALALALTLTLTRRPSA